METTPEKELTTVTTSKQFALNLLDLSKGVLFAFIGALITGLYQFIATVKEGENLLRWPTQADLIVIAQGAALVAFSYLVRNYFKPSQIIITPAKVDNEKSITNP